MNKKIIFIIIFCVLLVSTLIFGKLISSNNIIDEEISEDEIRLSFVGDIMTGRAVDKKVMWFGSKIIFKNVREHLSNSDISFGNFEGTISNNEGIKWKKCCEFKSSEKIVDGILYSGIDILSVTNNHMMDFGNDIYKETIKNLQDTGIKTVGVNYNEGYSNAQDFKIIEVKGKKIGFLAYYDNEYNKPYIHNQEWLPQPLIYEEEHFLQDINEYKNDVDILVVYMHWGEEYEDKHNKRQEEISHIAIDNGVDIIIGSHAHVVQEIEYYKDGIIAYGLGNFVSDQPTSLTPAENKEQTRESIILDIYVDKENNLSYKTNKIKIFYRFQPKLI